MTDDMSLMLKIAATLLMVASILTAVFAVMKSSTRIINSGINQTTAVLNSMADQQFSKYDGSQDLYGAQVKADLAALTSQNIAVIVRNSYVVSGASGVSTNYGWNYGPLLDNASEVEYNGRTAAALTSATATAGGTGAWTVDGLPSYEGQFTTPTNLLIDQDTGRYTYNHDLTRIDRTGEVEFIGDGELFSPSLGTDLAGNINAVIFTSVGNR